MKKSVGMIVVTLLVALALMGVSYGAWTETINITGVENMGILDVGFSTPGGTCPGVVSGDLNTLTITLNNAYPGFTCTSTFYVGNFGTVPVFVNQPGEVSDDLNAATLGSCYTANTVGVAGYTAPCTINIMIPGGLDNSTIGNTYYFTYTVLGQQP